MANKLIIVFSAALTLAVWATCNSPDKSTDKKSLTIMDSIEKKSTGSYEGKAKNKSGTPRCMLTTPELQKRKETVLSSLKTQMIGMQELTDGYAFKFPGTDKVLDELIEFIKTERACCDFFIFNLSISGDKSEAWLELTGGEGAKEFISTELGLAN
jgi:hypothetical protein